MTQSSLSAFGTPVETSGTSINIPLPSGVIADKGVLAFAFVDGAPRALTWPAGWQEPEGSPVDVTPNSHGLHIAWHRATGSESGNVTPTWTGSTFVSAFTALADDMITSGNPFDSPTGSAMSGTNVSISPTVSTTSLGPDRLLIHVATNWSGGTWTADSSPAFTKRQQGLENVLVVCTRDQPSAGGSGSVEATCTGNDKMTAWIGALIGTTPSGVTETGLPFGALAGSGRQADTGAASVLTLPTVAAGAAAFSSLAAAATVLTIPSLSAAFGALADAVTAAMQSTVAAGRAAALAGLQTIGTVVISRGSMRPLSRQTSGMTPTGRSTASMGP